MKVGLWIFIISFAINNDFGLAKVLNIPTTIHRNVCCGVRTHRANEIKYVMKLRQAVSECVDEFGLTHEPDEVILSQHVCIIECLGKKLNITDADGNLNEEGLRHFVKTDIPLVDHQRAVAGTTAMKCYEQAKASENVVAPNAEDLEYNGCGSAARKAISCVNIEFIKSCPKKLQTNTQNCVLLRQILTKDNIQIFMRHIENPFDTNI